MRRIERLNHRPGWDVLPVPEEFNIYDPDRPGIPFPEKRRLRAEDVVLAPPIENLLRPHWLRWEPRLRELGTFCRLNPVVVFGVCLVVSSAIVLAPAHRRAVEERQREVFRQQASMEVDAVLRHIGHSVRVTSVQVRDLDLAAAYYVDGAHVVVFDRDLAENPLWLLHVSAHECVHAIFDQAGLSRYWEGISYQVVEETTAEVLGAYLAGRVLTGLGEDGSRFSQGVITAYRSACSDDSPLSVKQDLFRRVFRDGGRGIDPSEFRMVLTHFGNERLVDEIDRICQMHPDPWEAAHEIAREYLVD